MRYRQRGLSLGGLLFWVIVAVIVVLFGMKIGPAYLEYYAARKAIIDVARDDANASPPVMRKDFDLRAAIDNMAISGRDLYISRQSGQTVISFAYRKDIPLFANIGLYINFRASSS